MRIERSLNLKQDGKSRLNSIIYFLRYGKKTSLEAYKQFQEITKDLRSKKAPGWIAEYLRGYFECQIEQINQNELEFVYIIDGEVYSTWLRSIPAD